MIKQRLARAVKALTGQCNHPEEEQALSEIQICGTCATELANSACPHDPSHNDEKSGVVLRFTERNRLVCMNCGNELVPPSKHFRSFIRFNKHIKLRTGIPRNRAGEKLAPDVTFNVGLRYVIPQAPNAVKRVWITFTDKKSQKSFAGQMDRRMRFCKDDEGYNAVINEAIDIIRGENPEVTEEVVEHGATEDE